MAHHLFYENDIKIACDVFLHPLLDRLGAGDEARTRDIQLGRLKLYQLSYSRSAPTHASPCISR